jgi:hypothetical protein
MIYFYLAGVFINLVGLYWVMGLLDEKTEVPPGYNRGNIIRAFIFPYLQFLAILRFVGQAVDEADQRDNDE